MADESTPVPTRDVLVAAYRPLLALQEHADRSRRGPLYNFEDRGVPPFLAAAHALQPIRPSLGSFQGWRIELKLAFRSACKAFDTLTEAWGWGWLLELSEPERLEAVARRRADFLEPIEREMVEAAVAVVNAWEGPEGPDEWREWKEPGRGPDPVEWAAKAPPGSVVTIAPVEAPDRFKDAARRRANMPTLGTCEPSFKAISENDRCEPRSALALALNYMRGYLADGEPIQAWRPGEGEAEPEAAPTEPAVVALPEPGGADFDADHPTGELVTIRQAAAMAHRDKRTLERYVGKDGFPTPAVEGGGGRPHLYAWTEMRKWIIDTFGINVPERFPASRLPMTTDNRRHA